jgi:hypothetical protein
MKGVRMSKITVTMTAVDGWSKRRYFKTVEGARKFAVKYVGETPEISWTYGYAISPDGVSKIEVGGDADVFTLFPAAAEEMRAIMQEGS